MFNVHAHPSIPPTPNPSHPEHMWLQDMDAFAAGNNGGEK